MPPPPPPPSSSVFFSSLSSLPTCQISNPEPQSDFFIYFFLLQLLANSSASDSLGGCFSFSFFSPSPLFFFFFCSLGILSRMVLSRRPLVLSRSRKLRGSRGRVRSAFLEVINYHQKLIIIIIMHPGLLDDSIIQRNKQKKPSSELPV